MRSIPRASLRAALSLAGVAAMTVGASAQQDEAVQKTTSAAPAAAASPAAPKESLKPLPPTALVPAAFGTIDIDQVMRSYDKFKVTQEKLQAEAMEEQNNLMKLGAKGKSLVEQLQRFKQGTEDFRKTTEEISEVKAKLESKKEALQQEFEMKAAETMINTYTEIQLVAEGVAKKYKMAYVVKVVRDQITANDRQSAQAVIAQPLIYSDSATDITKEVIYYLNLRYQKSGGLPPKTASAAPAPAAAAPAGATRQR